MGHSNKGRAQTSTLRTFELMFPWRWSCIELMLQGDRHSARSINTLKRTDNVVVFLLSR